jgi:hypothetical protein
MVLVDLNISTFRYPEYPRASPLALANPETPNCEIPKWQRVDKYRLTDEILLEDLRSVTTVRLKEETRALMPQPLSFFFVSSEEIRTVDPQCSWEYLDHLFIIHVVSGKCFSVSVPGKTKGENPDHRESRNPEIV